MIDKCVIGRLFQKECIVYKDGEKSLSKLNDLIFYKVFEDNTTRDIDNITVYFNEVDYPIPGGIDIKELLYFVYICRRYAKQLLIDLSEYKFKSFKSKEFKVYKKLIEDIAEIVET